MHYINTYLLSQGYLDWITEKLMCDICDVINASALLTDISVALRELRAKSLTLYSGRRLNNTGRYIAQVYTACFYDVDICIQFFKYFSKDDYMTLLAHCRGRPFFNPLKSVRESLQEDIYEKLYAAYLQEPLEFKKDSEEWEFFLNNPRESSIYDLVHRNQKDNFECSQNVKYCSATIAPCALVNISAETHSCQNSLTCKLLSIDHKSVSAYFNDLFFKFSESQMAAVAACLSGRNIWIYGVAGLQYYLLGYNHTYCWNIFEDLLS